MKTWRSLRFFLLGVIGLTVSPSIASFAEEPGAIVDGAGFTLFDTDRSKRPQIAKVEPDEAKPGDKVVITGEYFGTKECFHTVTFSAAPSTPVNFTFMNDSAIEATVPEAKPGMSFIIIVAGSGSAQSKPVLIMSK